jgi:hypothetical protein
MTDDHVVWFKQVEAPVSAACMVIVATARYLS